MTRIQSEQGERPCKTCGKRHWFLVTDDPANESPSWADPDDGHFYEPLSWEEMYRKAVAA